MRLWWHRERDALFLRQDTYKEEDEGHCPRSDNPEGTQAEIFDLDGMTMEGLKHLCVRFGLMRSGLRNELVQGTKIELAYREGSIAAGAQ